jgi:hypothetical protein
VTHEEAVLLLPDLAIGRLDARAGAALRSHLDLCEACRGLLDTYGILSAAMDAESVASMARHPSSEEIVAYALDAGSLKSEALLRIALHQRSCARCAAEVRATRQAEASGRRRTRPFGLGAFFLPARPGAAAALAATAVLLLLGYPAFLGIRRLPEVAKRADRLEQEMMRAGLESGARTRDLEAEFDRKLQDSVHQGFPGGPLGVQFVSSPRRGPESGEIQRIHMDRPFVHLGVDLDSGEVPAGPARYRLEIVADGKVVWWWGMTGDQIRQYLDSPQGSIIVAIPSSALRPGRHDLRISPEDAVGGRSLLRTSFVIEP